MVLADRDDIRVAERGASIIGGVASVETLNFGQLRLPRVKQSGSALSIAGAARLFG